MALVAAHSMRFFLFAAAPDDVQTSRHHHHATRHRARRARAPANLLPGFLDFANNATPNARPNSRLTRIVPAARLLIPAELYQRDENRVACSASTTSTHLFLTKYRPSPRVLCFALRRLELANFRRDTGPISGQTKDFAPATSSEAHCAL